MGERSGWTVAADRRIVGIQQTRRTWLRAGALTMLAGLTSSVRGQPPKKDAPRPEEEKAVASIQDKATKAGLKGFDTRRTEHFLGVGDGPEGYSAQALDLSERIARDFLAHFRKQGFKVDFPAQRLVVVTLKDAASYGAFSGEDPGQAIGGHYEPDANRLVIFDFRADQARQNAEAKRYNTFTLVHETIHLLCFNTGLLSIQDDVPVCISEGLATYGELWTRSRGQSSFGAVNGPRLQDLIKQMGGGGQWIPVSRLLTDDKLFDDPKTEHLAYAESWLLVHYLLETKEQRPKFQAYLGGLPKVDGGHAMSRDKYAESRLGSLRDLDAAVQRHARAMARRERLRIPAALSRARD